MVYITLKNKNKNLHAPIHWPHSICKNQVQNKVVRPMRIVEGSPKSNCPLSTYIYIYLDIPWADHE